MLILLVIPWVMLTLPFLVMSGWGVWKRFWVETEGVIVSSRLGTRPDIEHKHTTHYIVSYSYVVNNERHAGEDTVSIEVLYYEEAEIIAELRVKFKTGEPLVIYYPSSVPEISSARREVQGFWKALTLAGIGVGYALFYYIMFRIGGRLR